MKTIAVALVMMLAGVLATPYEIKNTDLKDQKSIDDLITGIVESVIEQIRQFDPYIVTWAEGEYNFPIVNGVFSARAHAKNFVFTGFSNINIIDISFVDNSLHFDLDLPQLEASVDEAAADVWILNRNLKADLSGRLAIKGLRLAGQVNLGLSGYFIDDLKLALRLGGIESELNVNIFGRDVSESVNNFLGNRLPNALIEYGEQLNRLIANLIMSLIDRLF